MDLSYAFQQGVEGYAEGEKISNQREQRKIAREKADRENKKYDDLHRKRPELGGVSHYDKKVELELNTIKAKNDKYKQQFANDAMKIALTNYENDGDGEALRKFVQGNEYTKDLFDGVTYVENLSLVHPRDYDGNASDERGRQEVNDVYKILKGLKNEKDEALSDDEIRRVMFGENIDDFDEAAFKKRFLRFHTWRHNPQTGRDEATSYVTDISKMIGSSTYYSDASSKKKKQIVDNLNLRKLKQGVEGTDPASLLARDEYELKEKKFKHQKEQDVKKALEPVKKTDASKKDDRRKQYVDYLIKGGDNPKDNLTTEEYANYTVGEREFGRMPTNADIKNKLDKKEYTEWLDLKSRVGNLTEDERNRRYFLTNKIFGGEAADIVRQANAGKTLAPWLKGSPDRPFTAKEEEAYLASPQYNSSELKTLSKVNKMATQAKGSAKLGDSFIKNLNKKGVDASGLVKSAYNNFKKMFDTTISDEAKAKVSLDQMSTLLAHSIYGGSLTGVELPNYQKAYFADRKSIGATLAALEPVLASMESDMLTYRSGKKVAFHKTLGKSYLAVRQARYNVETKLMANEIYEGDGTLPQKRDAIRRLLARRTPGVPSEKTLYADTPKKAEVKPTQKNRALSYRDKFKRSKKSNVGSFDAASGGIDEPKPKPKYGKPKYGEQG